MVVGGSGDGPKTSRDGDLGLVVDRKLVSPAAHSGKLVKIKTQLPVE